MKLLCKMCHRPVEVSLFTWLTDRPVFCWGKDLQGCIDTFTALYITPPEEEPEPDPDSIPPHDLNVCPRCEGVGEVFDRRDWSTGAYEFVTCRSCQGTGEVTPAWVAPVS